MRLPGLQGPTELTSRGNAPSLLSMSRSRASDSGPDRLGWAGSVASDSPLLQDDANGAADFAAALQERFLHESEFPGNVADDAVTPSPLPNVGAVHTYSPVWHKVVFR